MKKVEQNPLLRPSDHKGIPHCAYHPTVWASHKVLLPGQKLFVCAHCSRRPWPNEADVEKLKPLNSDGKTD